MRRALLALAALFTAGFGPARAQQAGTPPGAYRTAAAYLRRQPRPGGTDAFYPDKRGQLVVVVPKGPGTEKIRVAPASAWGFVSNQGRAFRLYRQEDYRLEHADTLCVYSKSTEVVGGARQSTGASPRYFFSRGLTGLIFPLTARYLREAYAASNPGFVAGLSKLPFHQSLVDFDRQTGLYRVTTLYRQAGGR